MIKCKVTKRKTIKVKAKGTPADITTEFLAITSEIYHQMKNVNEPAAEQFRLTLFASVVDRDSPVFK